MRDALSLRSSVSSILEKLRKAWRFCLNFVGAFELWPFTLDEFVQGFLEGLCSAFFRSANVVSVSSMFHSVCVFFLNPQMVHACEHPSNVRHRISSRLDPSQDHKSPQRTTWSCNQLLCCRYVSFDFHHICGSSSFENIELLYDQISEDFEKQGRASSTSRDQVEGVVLAGDSPVTEDGVGVRGDGGSVHDNAGTRVGEGLASGLAICGGVGGMFAEDSSAITSISARKSK
nr:phosphoinositide phosphatase SAC8 isoform X1 [Ipomoea batatas]